MFLCSPAITSRTRTARGSCTPRPVTAARTSTSGWRMRRSCKQRGIDTDHPLHRRRRRALHQGRAGLRGQARHRRQGQQGRRQRGRHQGAGRGRRADRARPAQAPVPPLLALQEARHLPQHAAVVHRHGQAAGLARPCRQRPLPLVGEGRGEGDRRTSAVVAPPTPNPSPQGGGESARRMRGNQTLREVALQAIEETEFVPASGQNRLRGMIESQARLGDLAPARLGRAHHRVPAQGDGRGDPVGQVRQVGRADGAHPRRHDREGRRRLVRGGRAASASSRASSPTPPTGRR